MKKLIPVISLLLIATIAINAQQSDFPKLIGKYLGQNLPGLTPEVFAPGIVSTLRNEHCPAAFSPNNDEVFWSSTDGKFKLFRSYLENGVWTPPSIPEFTQGLEATNPVFSVDGKKLFFISQIVENKKWFFTLWYVEKTPNGWSERRKVEEISSFGYIGYQVSFTRNGTIYFDSDKEGGFGREDLYRSTLVNGRFTQPENLGSPINSELGEGSPYVSPDETFILFRRHNRIENKLILDFYISFNKDGSWTTPILFTDKLGAKGDGMWIGMSPDQKYIFFVKRVVADQYSNDDMYWVDARIIEDLRKEALKDDK